MEKLTDAQPPEQLITTASSSSGVVRVVRYADEYREAWDAFVRRSMNGTLFHLQQFLAYHPPGRFHFHHLLFFEGDRLVAVLPGGLTQNGRHYESPVGASYGSFVWEDIDAATALAIVEAFESYIRELGVQAVHLTSAPTLYQPVLSQNLEFALLYKGYAYERHYISHITQLGIVSDPQDLFAPIAKRYIKRAYQHYRGIAIEEVSPDRMIAALTEFYPIIVENKARRNAKPTHSLEDLRRLHELLPELMKLWLLRLDGELIAGSLIFLPNHRVPLSFYPMMRYEFRDVRPIYVLSAEMMRWAQRQGYSYFDLGVSQDTSDDNPMTPALPLIEFKEKFHSRGILRSTLAKNYRSDSAA